VTPSCEVLLVTVSRREERRCQLVNNIRLLLAGVGIDYRSGFKACNGDEEDDRGEMWMLEGLSDRWFARGMRAACGLQLKDDPKAEGCGHQGKDEVWRGVGENGDDEDYDDL
jgi:hypothetical protein